MGHVLLSTALEWLASSAGAIRGGVCEGQSSRRFLAWWDSKPPNGPQPPSSGTNTASFSAAAVQSKSEEPHFFRAASSAGNPEDEEVFVALLPVPDCDGAFVYLEKKTEFHPAIYQSVQPGLSHIGAVLSEVRGGREALLQERLDSAIADLDKFAYAVSHDLKAPVHTITGFAELLASDPGDPENVAECLKYIQEGAQRLTALLGELLRYSRAGRQVDPPVLDTHAVLRPALEAFGNRVREAGGKLTENGGLPPLALEQKDLDFLFNALLDNALSFRSPDRPVEVGITVESEDGRHRFCISDNGIGIKADFHESVFDLFRRLHPTEPGRYGSGLAVCRRIVESTGGSIWLESAPGQGARVFFTLPTT